MATRAEILRKFASGAKPNGDDYASLLDFPLRPFQSGDSDPNSGHIPAGYAGLWKNTITGEIRWWLNDAGTFYGGPTFRLGPQFSPLSLFINGEEGGFWDMTDITRMFQDHTGLDEVTASGDPVGLVKDLSGNLLHLDQQTSGNKPTYTESGTDKFLSFDGTTDWLNCFPVAKPSSYTVIVAGRAGTLAQTLPFCGSGESGGLTAFQWGVMMSRAGADAGKVEWGFGDGSVGSYAATTEAPIVAGEDIILEQKYTDGDTAPQIYADNVLLTNGSITGSASEVGGTSYPFNIGRMGAYNSFFFQGRIYGAVFVDRILTNGERTSVREYFTDRMPLS